MRTIGFAGNGFTYCPKCRKVYYLKDDCDCDVTTLKFKCQKCGQPLKTEGLCQNCYFEGAANGDKADYAVRQIADVQKECTPEDKSPRLLVGGERSFVKVFLMRWGKTQDGYIYPRQDVKLPAVPMPVVFNFDYNHRVGYADNFKVSAEGIVCDVHIDPKVSSSVCNTVAPSFLVNNIAENKANGLELQGVSLILGNHAKKDCTNNLKEVLKC